MIDGLHGLGGPKVPFASCIFQSISQFKLKGVKFKGNLGGNFFTQRVVFTWNEVTQEVVDADTNTMFKYI